MPDHLLCVSHLFGQLFVQRSAPQGMIPLGLLVHAQSKCMQAATSVCRCFFTCGLTVDCQGPGKFSRHCNSWGRALAPPLLNVTAEKCFHTSIRISATRKSWLEHLQAVEENWVCNNNNFSWYRVSCFLCFLVGFFLELLLSLAQAINDRSQFLLGVIHWTWFSCLSSLPEAINDRQLSQDSKQSSCENRQYPLVVIERIL